MATVRYARFETSSGFSRAVAIKRLHPHLADDAALASLFLDEARVSARISHANVVATIDVLSDPDQIAVVMEYVHGESLATLLSLAERAGAPVPTRIAVALLVGVLHGLHAAHETRGEQGEPLGIVHRDVSPENVLVGVDGVARVLDFGIAKAKGRCRTTPSGELKGKLGYMAPEQFRGAEADRRVDVYGAAVVLWETLTGRSLFAGDSDAALVHAVLNEPLVAPSSCRPEVPAPLDALVMRGLARDPEQRFQTARDFSLALERTLPMAPQSEVSDWLHQLAGAQLARRADVLRQMQQESDDRRDAGEPEPDGSTRRLPAQAAEQVLTRLAQMPESTQVSAPVHGTGLTQQPRSRRALVLAALALLLTGGVWLALTLRAEPAPAPVGAAPLAAPTPRQAEVPQATPPVAPPVPVQEPVPSAPAPTPEPPLQPELAPEKSKARRSARKDDDDCTPPYDIDKLGIRRWKRKCL